MEKQSWHSTISISFEVFDSGLLICLKSCPVGFLPVHPIVGCHHLAAARSCCIAQSLDRNIVLPELLAPQRGRDGSRCAVGYAAAIVEPQSQAIMEHSVPDPVLSHVVSVLWIAGTVIVALHRDHRQVLFLSPIWAST